MSVGSILTQGAAVRLAFGACALIEPEATSRLLGVPARRINDSSAYVLRLFAARDVVLGLVTATASSATPPAQRRAVIANLTAEMADSAALALEVRRRGGLRGDVLAGALFNLAGYATWIAAARALREPSA